MTSVESNNFKFWCPLEKASDIDPDTGEQIMKLGGIASTSDEDSDGEFLDPEGFDIEPLLKSGIVNWHHQAKGQPAAIIGEPTMAELRPEGLYIETLLYPSSKMAQEVWELAEVLEKDSTTRRLGYSIEGKVLKRKNDNKFSPDYKRVEKAIITGVAVTHQPKNPKTFANIIKGEIDDDLQNEEVEKDTKEKALSADGNGADLKKESVDEKMKRTTFSKSQTLEILFRDIPAINIEKAEQIYLMLKKVAKMKGRKNVNSDDILKAYEALGLEVNEDIVKGKDSEEMEDYQENPDDEDVKKSDEDVTEEDIDEDEDEEDIDEDEDVKKGGLNRFDRLEKAIATSHQINSRYIKALGVMLKDSSQKLDAAAERESELIDLVKAQEDTISVMTERLEAFGSDVPSPKSLSASRPVERVFAKSNENEFAQKGGHNSNQVSMSRQSNVVANILDEVTFAKGFDDEFSKAVTHFEATKNLPPNIIARIKNELGIEIVK